MNLFLLGIVTALILVACFVALNHAVTPIINFLLSPISGLDDKDKATLSKLLKFKIHWLIEAVFLLALYGIGYWCGAVI